MFWVSSSMAKFKLPDVVGPKITNENSWAEIFSDGVIRNASHTGSAGVVFAVLIVTVIYSLIFSRRKTKVNASIEKEILKTNI